MIKDRYAPKRYLEMLIMGRETVAAFSNRLLQAKIIIMQFCVLIVTESETNCIVKRLPLW